MKLKEHIEPKGIYEIQIGESWKYHLDQGEHTKVHTYTEYEIWKTYNFKLSIREVSIAKVGQFSSWIEGLDSFEMDGKVFYRGKPDVDATHTTIAWFSQQKNQNIIFTITYTNERDEELDPLTDKDKYELIERIIPTFNYIEESERESKLNSYRFRNFIRGVGASAYMLSEAVKNKAFIEATCLLATQIDSLLRTAIVLQLQINNSNNEIEKEWIYQGLDDKKKSEKDIYKKAVELGILSEELNTRLYELYNDRNRVIHRFVISEITLAEVEEIAYSYSILSEEINSILYDIEAKQIELNVGITRTGNGDDENPIDFIRGKIAKNGYFKDEEASR